MFTDILAEAKKEGEKVWCVRKKKRIMNVSFTLEKVCLVLCCELRPGFLRDLPIGISVALVPTYHNPRRGVCGRHFPLQEHILDDEFELLEAVGYQDAVNEKKPVPALDGCLGGAGVVLLLPGRVDKLHVNRLPTDRDSLPEGILDRWVVGVHVLVLKVAHEHAALPYAPIPQYQYCYFLWHGCFPYQCLIFMKKKKLSNL